MVIIAIFAVIAALIFYSIATWKELLTSGLKKINIVLYWIGLIFDISGTLIMSFISQGFSMNFHSFAGLSALLLMLIKTIYSTKQLVTNNTEKTVAYKSVTVIIWIVWVAVFINGIIVHK